MIENYFYNAQVWNKQDHAGNAPDEAAEQQAHQRDHRVKADAGSGDVGR